MQHVDKQNQVWALKKLLFSNETLNYYNIIAKMKAKKLKSEALKQIEAPFSFLTQLTISGVFASIQWMLFSISTIVSSTFKPAVLASEMKLSRWAAVLIASAKTVKVSLKGALLQQRKRKSDWNSGSSTSSLTSRWLLQSFPWRTSSLMLYDYCSF